MFGLRSPRRRYQAGLAIQKVSACRCVVPPSEAASKSARVARRLGVRQMRAGAVLRPVVRSFQKAGASVAPTIGACRGLLANSTIKWPDGVP
jgi:hypothetical protein